MVIAHIGFDDIDTPYGGCTTHFTALFLAKILREKNLSLIDYPNLVRLNPGVPWKTRGNGGTVIRFKTRDEDEAYSVFEEAIVFLENYLREYSGEWTCYSQPSIALFLGEINSILKWFSGKALYDLIPISLLERTIGKLGDYVKFFTMNKKRGLIGALASIGYRMVETDYTYELIAYRTYDMLEKPRRIDPASIIEMDKLYGEYMILNYDYEINRPLIIPHGPDPVLLGIRGEDPEILIKAYKVLRIGEKTSIRMIYRTNQHTDAHLRSIENLSKAYVYRSIKVRVTIATKPRRSIGGHVFFKVMDNTDTVDVAVYEPTSRFRDIVEKLEPGDEVEVMGIVRPQSSKHGKTINLEKLHVLTVKPKIILENPFCPRCGARMKSMGRGKGFKCPKCGYRSRNISKIKRIVKRDLKPGWYEPPPRVFKHLMKPIKRIGFEKKSFPRIFTPSNYLWIDDKLIA